MKRAIPTTMRSVVGYANRVVVEERPVPEPGQGQVLIRSRACGVCGSDLHFVRHFDEIYGGPDGVHLGHEFVGEVAAHGPGAERIATGTRVASVPFVTESGTRLGVGTSRRVPGAFSEYFLLDAADLILVPDDLPDEIVTLAEPLAVGIHAVARGEVSPADAVLVIGCGPVGLATVAALRMRGVTTVIASDPKASRRDMALDLGASRVVDPTIDDDVALLAQLGAEGRHVVIECAGVTPLVPTVIKRAPTKTRVVLAGVHLAEVTISPMIAMTKELDLRFSFYYTADEFAAALDALATGRVDLAPIITATVGLDDLPDTFELLFAPNDHIKVVVKTKGTP